MPILVDDDVLEGIDEVEMEDDFAAPASVTDAAGIMRIVSLSANSSSPPDFISSSSFDGPRDHYFFKAGKFGTGYYRDGVPESSMCVLHAYCLGSCEYSASSAAHFLLTEIDGA